MALLLIAIALAGFWPRYYGPLVSASGLDLRASHPLIHLHSILFMGWLLMLLGQALLVRSGRIRLHRKLGPWLAGYGFALVPVGLWAGLVLAPRRVEFGRTLDHAASFMFVVITDILTFAAFLTAALVWRNRPEAHKRLMVLAAWSLAIVGFNRLLFNNMPVLQEHRLLTGLVMPLPALIGILHDWTVRRRVHPVWWIGLFVFLLWANRRFVSQSEAWLPIGRDLVRIFGA